MLIIPAHRYFKDPVDDYNHCSCIQWGPVVNIVNQPNSKVNWGALWCFPTWGNTHKDLQENCKCQICIRCSLKCPVSRIIFSWHHMPSTQSSLGVCLPLVLGSHWFGGLINVSLEKIRFSGKIQLAWIVKTSNLSTPTSRTKKSIIASTLYPIKQVGYCLQYIVMENHQFLDFEVQRPHNFLFSPRIRPFLEII